MTYRWIVAVTLLVFTSTPASANEDPLRRQAYFGAVLRSPQGQVGAEVARVRDGSAAALAGLQQGDRILKMNGHALTDSLQVEKLVNALRGGDTLRLEVKRGPDVFLRSVNLPEMPREAVPGLQIDYGSVRSRAGFRVRTILTRPADTKGPLPGIFVAPWLSCDSVEMPFGPADDGMLTFLYELATKSGYVTMRVERPGLGDSEGPACSESDFQTELQAFRAAFQAFRESPKVDRNRIFIVGLSNGGGYAPLVGQPGEVAGFVSIGGWAKTWFEHMMEHERRRLVLQGVAHGDVAQRMEGYAEFYTDYLIHKLTPGEVGRRKPHLAKPWYDLPGHQYGRPAAYYHQLQELNLLSAWQAHSAPVLSIWGAHDWIMSREDHELIAAVANQKKPGNGRFVILPRTAHGLNLNESDAQTFENFGTGTLNPSAVRTVLDWLHEVGGTSAPRPPASDDDQSALFRPFLGEWDFELVQSTPDAGKRTGGGEWRFEQILGGRAIQDVWTARFAETSPGAPPDGYGTTLRIYDPSINAWRIVWMSAVRREIHTFLARKVGDEIVLEMVRAPGAPESGKWIFYEIQADSFRWRAVESTDGGQSWRVLQEMSARRRTRPPVPSASEAPGR